MSEPDESEISAVGDEELQALQGGDTGTSVPKNHLIQLAAQE